MTTTELAATIDRLAMLRDLALELEALRAAGLLPSHGANDAIKERAPIDPHP
jgi:hypothetical protein